MTKSAISTCCVLTLIASLLFVNPLLAQKPSVPQMIPTPSSGYIPMPSANQGSSNGTSNSGSNLILSPGTGLSKSSGDDAGNRGGLTGSGKFKTPR